MTASSTPAARASSMTASRSSGLREANALATATPQRWGGVSDSTPSTDCRLILRSRAASGSDSRSESREAIAPPSGRERRLALLPVARAELVRLQRIEGTQDLVHVATHGEVVHRHEA